MAIITGVSTTTTTSSSDAPRKTGPQELGQGDFLNLLVTQLKNQDPLKPTDNTEFVAQLAQFSQLDQSAKQAKLLEQSLALQNASLQFTMLPMVGRNVSVDRPLVQLGNGPAQIQYALDNNAATVHVTILDQDHRVVRSLDYADRQAGLNTAEWDGRSNTGTLMPAGVYEYAVTAIDRAGSPVTTASQAQLTVSGMRIEEGKPKLLVGNVSLDPSSIIEVR